MRKIPKDVENPLDNINVDLMDKLCPSFKKVGFTPNGITTLSLLFGLISLWFLWHHKVILFAITYYISYLFDCMDGHFARKYKMVSKFGDVYDHVKDIVVMLGVFAIIFLRYTMSKKVLVIFIVTVSIFAILMSAQLGCQERLYPKKESESLAFSKHLCFNDPHKTIKITRWFGCGTFVVFLISWVIYLHIL